MKKGNFVLKEAVPEDYDEYYKIRSEEGNLYWTGYEKPPDYEGFREWYKSRINDPHRHLYLLYVDDACAGSLNIDYYDDFAAIGYSVLKAYEGRGYATFMVKEAIRLVKEAKKQRGKISLIKAWIIHLNTGSIRVVEKNGFKVTDHKEKRKWFGREELYLEYAYEL